MKTLIITLSNQGAVRNSTASFVTFSSFFLFRKIATSPLKLIAIDGYPGKAIRGSNTRASNHERFKKTNVLVASPTTNKLT
jgi:hypothetical protein